MIQSAIFTCSLQRRLCSFQSMLMSVHLQSGTVSSNTQALTENATASFIPLVMDSLDYCAPAHPFPLIMLISIIIPIW